MVKPKGLLDAFIQERLSQHREPTRKGVPRGERIGFLRPKYHASLLCALRAVPLKDIAEELGVSHGLLMKWNTEKDFIGLMYTHLTDFTEHFSGSLADHAESLRRCATKDWSGEAPRLACGSRYGLGLLLKICQVLVVEDTGTFERTRVINAHWWKPRRDKVLHPFPRQDALLTTSQTSEVAKDPFFALAAYQAISDLRRAARSESRPYKRGLDKTLVIAQVLGGWERSLLGQPHSALERVANHMQATILDIVKEAIEKEDRKAKKAVTFMLRVIRKEMTRDAS
ncbi:MAG: hypothetical protein V3U06_06540 [Candidatus Binatia bacterium]